MPLPYADFPASSATFDLSTGEISYETAGALAEGGSVAGEVLAGAAEVGIAAALAEPALVIGTGLLGLMALDAAIKHFSPTRQVPNFTQLYQGGQTNGTRYQFTVEFTSSGGQTSTFTAQRNGPISGMQAQKNANGTTTYTVITGEGPYNVGAFPDDSLSVAPHLTSVTRVGGLPDSGQNPAIVPANPGLLVLPPPVRMPINQPTGDPIEITFIPYPSQRNLPTVQPGQRINPGLIVAVPEAGQIISFNPNGVVIRYREPWASPYTAPPVPQLPTPVPFPPAECECPPPDFTEIICRLKALESGLLFDGYEYTSHSFAGGDSATITGINDELYAVVLNVTPPTINPKKQSGNANAPEIIYCGWFSFIVKNGQLPREPIHYAEQAYVPRADADGFSFTVTLGGTANGVYYTRKKKDYADNC